MILEDPLDPAGWLVYGDWLQAEGDPRGELVAVQARHARDPGNPELLEAQRALFRRHGQALLEGLHPWLRPSGSRHPLLRLSWEFGFLWTATLAAGYTTDAYVAGLRDLLGHPSARFLHALSLPAPEEDDWRPILETFAEGGERPLRMLFLGRDSTFGWKGDLGTIWPVLPHLRCLELIGGNMVIGDLARPSLPSLRELVITTSALSHETMRAIGARPWPELEKLEIWFGERRCTSTLADLKPLLDGDHFPRLRHLALRNCGFVDRLCSALAEAKITRQLSVLDLSLGALTDRGVDALLAARRSFEHLAVLDLHHNYLDEALAAEATTLARFVDVSDNLYGVPESYREEPPEPPQVWLDT